MLTVQIITTIDNQAYPASVLSDCFRLPHKPVFCIQILTHKTKGLEDFEGKSSLPFP